MKALRYAALAAVVAIAGLALGQSPKKQARRSRKADRSVASGADRVAGAGWEDQRGAPQPQGMLIYTRDGHMSVQLMYPNSSNARSNEYVQDGYEASFGSYDVDEATHTLTHHVRGSITRDLLVGKDLPRIYQFTRDGKLVIRSARPEEHWSVTWVHY